MNTSAALKLRPGEFLAEHYNSPQSEWINRRGKRYGLWTAIQPTVWKTFSGESYTGCWLLQCDCGALEVRWMGRISYRTAAGVNAGCWKCGQRARRARAQEQCACTP